MKIQLNAAARLLAAEEVATASFHDWSRERQDKYLKEHPGSKYGKGVGSKYKPPKFRDTTGARQGEQERPGPAEKIDPDELRNRSFSPEYDLSPAEYRKWKAKNKK